MGIPIRIGGVYNDERVKSCEARIYIVLRDCIMCSISCPS